MHHTLSRKTIEQLIKKIHSVVLSNVLFFLILNLADKHNIILVQESLSKRKRRFG